MATIVTIGGAAYTVPVMNFATLKAAWGDIKALPTSTDPVEQAGIAARILSTAMRRIAPEMTPEAIEEAATVPEYPALVIAVGEILREAGLVPQGEQKGAATGAPSTTSTI